jgi:hypothetical protein
VERGHHLNLVSPVGQGREGRLTIEGEDGRLLLTGEVIQRETRPVDYQRELKIAKLREAPRRLRPGDHWRAA